MVLLFSSIHKDNIYKNLYNGTWVESFNFPINIYSPENGNLIGGIQSMSKKEINTSILNSRLNQKHWQKYSPKERSFILNKAADVLSENKNIIYNLLQSLTGMNEESAIYEVKETIKLINLVTEEANKNPLKATDFLETSDSAGNSISFSNLIPIGVILAISPSKHPLYFSALQIATALATGNSVLLKPSTQGAIVCLYLAEIFRIAGVPKGLLNTITGNSSDIGDYLVTHKSVNFINFIGKPSVGRHITALSNLIPMSIEFFEIDNLNDNNYSYDTYNKVKKILHELTKHKLILLENR